MTEQVFGVYAALRRSDFHEAELLGPGIDGCCSIGRSASRLSSNATRAVQRTIARSQTRQTCWAPEAVQQEHPGLLADEADYRAAVQDLPAEIQDHEVARSLAGPAESDPVDSDQAVPEKGEAAVPDHR